MCDAAVLVCAALDVEYQAIREHISGLVTEVSERGTLYEIATMPTSHGVWKLVLTLADRDNIGAAVQVERAIAAFRPRLTLFVGVAGGRRDTRIGDVVAASLIYNYEAGADTSSGLLPRIRTLNSSFRLVQQAHAVVREARWISRIKPGPPAEPPAAFVRPLAAGTKVVHSRSSRTARLIDLHCGDAAAVEMEGFGVLHAAYVNGAEAMVIRGISDLLDGKDKGTDRVTQPAAARNAAAFAFELLHRLSPDLAPAGAAAAGHISTQAFRLEGYRFTDPASVTDAKPSNLSALLRAASHIVPFTGREAELSRLESWRDSPGGRSALLVTGPAGQGKTRLASRFAADSAASGWTVLQARHGPDPQVVPESVTAGRAGDVSDVLVVVDYAERWPRLDLEQLLQHPRLSLPGRVRFLLLARPAGYWWKALANPLAKLGCTATQLSLGPLADTVAERKLAFATARNRFAEILGAERVSRLQPAGSLADDAYKLALTLHMAALVAVDAHRRKSSAPDDPGQLSRYLIGREYDHWQTMRDNGRISSSPPIMARMVALATLTQSLPLPAAADLLVAAGLAANRADAQLLLDDHTTCYPAASDPSHVLEPLRPDRLGEDFLADLMPTADVGSGHGDAWMTGIPGLLLASAAGESAGCGQAALSVLVETARRWEHVRERYVVPLLTDQPTVALRGGGASLVTLAGYADLTLLQALDTVLPRQRHVELDSGIAALAQRLTAYGLTQTTDEAKRAHLYEELASRYSNAGLYREALETTADAILIRRRLAEASPAEHRPMLADSLGNIGIDLWNLGRSAEALEAMTEAVAIYRHLVDAQPAAYQADLAAELNNLAGSLLGLDRYAEALAPASEATAIFRQLTAAGQDLKNELGSCLRNLASILTKVGRPEEALAAAQEAVENYRYLSERSPETYEPELAESLRSLSQRLSGLQRHDEALRVAEEGAVLARRLAAVNPAAHQDAVALALQSVATRLWNAGQRERSLAVSEEAMSLQRDLVDENPHAHERGLGIIVNSYADHLLEASRPHEALLASEEAVRIWSRLSDAAPGTHASQLRRAQATHERALSAVREPADRPG